MSRNLAPLCVILWGKHWKETGQIPQHRRCPLDITDIGADVTGPMSPMMPMSGCLRRDIPLLASAPMSRISPQDFHSVCSIEFQLKTGQIRQNVRQGCLCSHRRVGTIGFDLGPATEALPPREYADVGILGRDMDTPYGHQPSPCSGWPCLIRASRQHPRERHEEGKRAGRLGRATFSKGFQGDSRFEGEMSRGRNSIRDSRHAIKK